MSSLAAINIKFTADMAGFSKEMQTMAREIDKAGKRLSEIGRGLSTYVTLPILAAGAASIKFASDYNESLNKVDVAFKTSSNEVKNFAKTSLDSFGIAEGTALDLASTYGDMGTSLGLSTDKASKMSTSLVGLAGDLASFKNISIEVANTALAGVFTGETESLKKLGIVMTEANLQDFAYSKGMKVKIADMDQASKVNLRYAYIMSVTKNAQGDFERTGGGAANQMRIFQESLKQVGQQIGSVILPLFTSLITAVNEKIKAFGKLSEGTKTVIVVVAGLAAAIGPLLLGIGAVLQLVPFIIIGFTAIASSIVPIVVGIGLLTSAYILFSGSTSSVSSANQDLINSQETVNKINNDAASIVGAQKSQLEALVSTVKNETASKKEKLKAIQEINKISPEYLGNITLENINTDKAREAIEKYNVALLAGGKAKAAQNLLSVNAQKQIAAELSAENALAGSYSKIEKAQKELNKSPENYYKVLRETTNLQGQQQKILEDKLVPLKKEEATILGIYNKYSEYLKLLKSDDSEIKKIGKPEKRIDLKPIDTPDSLLSNGSKASYEAQIAELQKFADAVGTTEAQVNAANDRITALKFAENMKFDPSSIIKSGESVIQIGAKLQAESNRFKSSLTEIKGSIIDVSQQINQAVSQLGVDLATSLASTIGNVMAGAGSIDSIFSGLIGIVGSFLQSLGKSLIQVGLASQAFKEAFSNPWVAVGVGVALLALGAAFKSTMSAGPKTAGAFADGGIVGGQSYYGDKILARVNSGELILNTQQQARLHSMITPAVNANDVAIQLMGGFEIEGTKLKLLIERTDNRNNRTR